MRRILDGSLKAHLPDNDLPDDFSGIFHERLFTLNIVSRRIGAPGYAIDYFFRNSFLRESIF